MKLNLKAIKRSSTSIKQKINTAEITQKTLSSIATTAATTSIALTGIGIPYSIPAIFATAPICGS